MSSQVVDAAVNSLVCRQQLRSDTGFGAGELACLAESIRAVGVLQPLLVRREGSALIVLDGERRLRASILAGRETVPIIVEEKELAEPEVTERQLILDIQRVHVGPIERAKAIARMMEALGWTADRVAQRLGQSPASVSRSLSLLKLPPGLQVRVASGELAADAAYQLSRVSDPTEQATLALESEGGKLSRDALARKLKSARRAEERRGEGSSRCKALLGKCAVTVDGPGLSLESMIGWLEDLLTRARKAKAQGLTLETFTRALKDQAGGRKAAAS